MLGYWRDRSNKVGDIAKMTCDVLSIPITTVASNPFLVMDLVF